MLLPFVKMNRKRENREAGCGMQGMLAGMGGGISIDNRVKRRINLCAFILFRGFQV